MEKLAPEITEAERGWSSLGYPKPAPDLPPIAHRRNPRRWMATLRDAAAAVVALVDLFSRDGVLKGEGVRSTPVTAAPGVQSASKTQTRSLRCAAQRKLSEAVTGLSRPHRLEGISLPDSAGGARRGGALCPARRGSSQHERIGVADRPSGSLFSTAWEY